MLRWCMWASLCAESGVFGVELHDVLRVHATGFQLLHHGLKERGAGHILDQLLRGEAGGVVEGFLADVLSVAGGGPGLLLLKGGVLNVVDQHGLDTGRFLHQHLDRVEQVGGFHVLDLQGQAKGSNPELSIKAGFHRYVLLLSLSHGLASDGVDAVVAVPGRSVGGSRGGTVTGSRRSYTISAGGGPVGRSGRGGGSAANPGKVGGGGGLAAQGLPVTGLEDVAQAAANALVAAVGIAEKADGHTAIHAAVNVRGGQLTVDVVDAHHLGLVLGGGGQDPVALALIAKGDAGGPDTITVMDGHLEHGGPGPVPHLGQGILGGGVDGGVNVRLGGPVRLGDEQGDGILGLTVLLGGSGSGQAAIGEAHLAGQHFHGVILIHSLCSPF
uniref:Uncharacterized protein n=1 Tax=Myoviridae sp. ctQ6D10 TaxID=2827288 RepID=A0A8S5R5U9_9CAUD|nr:MAG TPA: hypothetical protein [Myoviridae sp. ctQ6D10]